MGKQSVDKHLTDVELMLRVFGLRYMCGEYEKPMKEFLNKVSARYRKTESGNVREFVRDFPKACEVILQNLPTKPFSVRGPLNTSIFDSIFCSILKHIDNLPNNLRERYDGLIHDQQFVDYTTLGTTDTKILKSRLDYVESFLFY